MSAARPLRKRSLPKNHGGAPSEPWGKARSAKGAE